MALGRSQVFRLLRELRREGSASLVSKRLVIIRLGVVFP